MFDELPERGKKKELKRAKKRRKYSKICSEKRKDNGEWRRIPLVAMKHIPECS